MAIWNDNTDAGIDSDFVVCEYPIGGVQKRRTERISEENPESYQCLSQKGAHKDE